MLLTDVCDVTHPAVAHHCTLVITMLYSELVMTLLCMNNKWRYKHVKFFLQSDHCFDVQFPVVHVVLCSGIFCTHTDKLRQLQNHRYMQSVTTMFVKHVNARWYCGKENTQSCCDSGMWHISTKCTLQLCTDMWGSIMWHKYNIHTYMVAQ